MALFMLGFWSVSASAEDPPWRSILEQQLDKEKGCQVNFLTNIREFELAGEAVIEGRAHCVDGRQFDVTRKKKHLPFEIRLCEPTYC